MSNMNMQQVEPVVTVKTNNVEGLQGLIKLYDDAIEKENTRWNVTYKASAPTNDETAAHFQKIRTYRARLADAKMKLDALQGTADYTPTPEAVEAYENRIEAKRERFTDRAAKANGESNSVRNRAHTMYKQIPFGQPILVGHHSERGDRNFRNKIHTLQGKAFALMQKAEHYEAKAANIGTGGISSDDPSAIIKLIEELSSLQKNQDLMKAANKAIKAAKTPEAQQAALIALGFDEKNAHSILNPRHGRAGFASYSLSNNNANIKRVQTRIEELKALKSREDVEEVAEGYTYREDVADNRIHFVFDGKPSENVRVLLKSYAFKWSPSRSAWVRQLNANGLYAAQKVKEKLIELI